MRHVLVVEDDPDIRESLKDVLEDAGWQVSLAQHGAEALVRLREVPKPRVVLVDLLMPVMDGLEFLQRLAADPDLQDTPVVVASASSTTQPPEGTPFLRKPLEVDELLAMLDATVR